MLLLRCRGEEVWIGPDFPSRYVHVTFEMCVGLPSRGLRSLFAVILRDRDYHKINLNIKLVFRATRLDGITDRVS